MESFRLANPRLDMQEIIDGEKSGPKGGRKASTNLSWAGCRFPRGPATVWCPGAGH